MSSQCHESMLKRVTFLLIGLIISIEGEKFASKYFEKTIELLDSEMKIQNEKFKQILSQTEEKVDKDELEKLEKVKKQMGDFFGDIDVMIQEETTVPQDLSQVVSKQELVTMISAISIFDKLNQNQTCWKKMYKLHMTSPEGFTLINNFLDMSKLVCMFSSTNNEDALFTNIRSLIYKIITKWFENMENDGDAYKSNESVTKMIDYLSTLMIKHYIIDDQVITMATFVMLNILNRDSDDRIPKLEKMFNMCSYAGRKIMMNLKRDVKQLVCILRFFLSSIAAIKDVDIIKTLAKPMLHLGYKMYTNPHLAETDTKVISAELVETLQNKLDQYDYKYRTEHKGEDDADKSIATSTFIQMYNEIKTSSDKNKKDSKLKRKINRLNDLDRHKRKRADKRHKKRQAEKAENQKYLK